MNTQRLCSSLAVALVLTACNSEEKTTTEQSATGIEIWPELDIQVKQDPKIEARVDKLISEMTLEQKVAQMIQPEIKDITVEEMRQYGFGSYLNGGGSFPNQNKHATPADWVDLAEKMYQASIDDSIDGSTIPTMWGTDAVHGHNNVIGATLFPHNIGLGAANNAELIEKIAHITAKEVLVTGIDWIFAPTVATVRDDRWGRTYEGYSEDPEIVKSYSTAIVKGLQGTVDDNFLGDGRVISTVKHFVGDGGTVGGDDQGNNIVSEQELFDIHAQGYVGGLTVGAQSVMASFNSWHGNKIHGDEYLLTKVLKDRMGFDGLVVGDWNGHGQVAGCSNTSCPQAINAGIDIVMVPSDWKALYENTIAQVKDGQITQARIDDAVRRILRVKVRAGLLDNPSPANRAYSGKVELVGAQAHRDVAKQAVRESLVLLKNKSQTLPLSPKLNVLVAGDAADNIGKQSGGWTITWQGTGNSNEEFPGGTSILDGIKQQVTGAGGSVTFSQTGEFDNKPDVAIVVFGEEPYAEGVGDVSDLEYQKGDKSDLTLLKKLKEQGIPVVSVLITGRPLWINSELNASDAFVAAWLPGSEGSAVADVLFKDINDKVQHDFKGKLSFSWPNTPTQIVNRNDEDYQPLLPYGFGLQYGDDNVLKDDLNETVAVVDGESSAVFIHKTSLQKGWEMAVVADSQELAVNASSHVVANASYRTIDKLVQEDAFMLTNKGNASAGIKISSSKNLDSIRDNFGDNSALVLEVNNIKMSDKPLWLTISCDQPNCNAKVNLNDELKWLAGNQWHRLAINLECIVGKLKQAESMQISVSSEGVYEAAFSNIQIRNETTNVQLKCK